MVISESKVTVKGQVTLPVSVMKELGISPGENIIFEQHGDSILIKPSKEKVSVTDIHKKYSHLNTKRGAPSAVKKAREEAWLQRHKRK